MEGHIEVKLDVFEGPLDLLLHLVRKDKLNIYDIPISRITEQYLEYLTLMQGLNINVAGEFLAMAATLLYIKSRMLLPEAFEDDEEDPREELARRLLEHQLFQETGQHLGAFALLGRDVFAREMPQEETDSIGVPEPELAASLFDLLRVYREVLSRMPHELQHEIELEPMTAEQKMEQILAWLAERGEGLLEQIFQMSRNRFELVLCFIAVLELAKRRRLAIFQKEAFGSVLLRRTDYGNNGH